MKVILVLIAIFLSACSSVSLADQAQLSKPSMSFEQMGADFTECTLVSQLERGRSTGTQNAGGACASCH